jgi:hypothetical protein
MWRGPRCVHFLPPSGLDPCPIKAPSHFRDAALLRITWEKTQSLFACHAVVRECVPGMCNEADSSGRAALAKVEFDCMFGRTSQLLHAE